MIDLKEHPECDKFIGRKREICRGEAGLLLNGKHGTNAYRIHWGLPPLAEDGRILSPEGSLKLGKLSTTTFRPKGGVGTELKKLLAWFGQYAGEGCNCKKHAEEMDNRGIVWCESNIPTIVGWMKEEAAKKKVAGFSIDDVPGAGYLAGMAAAVIVRQAIANAKEALSKLMPPPFPQQVGRNPFEPSGRTPPYVSTSRYMDDLKLLAQHLPPDTARIVGVARSGLCAASMLAMLLHLPCDIVRQSSGDMVIGGHGWRLTGRVGGQGPTVVIDDTVMSGNSFKHVMPIVWRTYPGAISASVYVNPHSRLKPDIYVHEIPWPHILEWNLFNSVLAGSMAVDFDGILCDDCRPDQDDDGPKYLEFLRTTKPKWMMRKQPIPLIVTARLEKYRSETMDWLARHGMKTDKLIMGPWKTLSERYRNLEEIPAFKAKHYAEFLKRRHRVKPPMLVESEEWQARIIANKTGGIVVCPAAGKCFP